MANGPSLGYCNYAYVFTTSMSNGVAYLRSFQSKLGAVKWYLCINNNNNNNNGKTMFMVLSSWPIVTTRVLLAAYIYLSAWYFKKWLLTRHSCILRWQFHCTACHLFSRQCWLYFIFLDLLCIFRFSWCLKQVVFLFFCIKIKIILLYTVFYCVQNGIMKDIEGLLKEFSLLTTLCNVCVTWTVAVSQLRLALCCNDNLYKYSILQTTALCLGMGYICQCQS